jgi:hypothetical protein
MTGPDVVRDQQLADIAELVEIGPVDLGAYTQAELAVVLGELPGLAGVTEPVLAEAVRSLAARGLLYREPDEHTVSVVGDLGLIVALAATRTGTLEIRRGHPGAPDQPWRWAVSLLPRHVVAIDRVDALGLHRFSLHSVHGVADVLVDRLIDGRARIPAEEAAPTLVDDAELRALTESATTRWQLIHRVPRADGTFLVVDALVLRTGESRVDLVSRTPDEAGYQRVPVDAAALRTFLIGLTTLR